MLLTSIDARNLLSFESLGSRFDKGLNVVVGQNDVGKSNLVRLVKLVRDAVIASSGGGLQPLYGYGFERRFVRLGGPGLGRVSLGVEFDQIHERALLLLLVRAIAAQNGESQANQPRTPDEWAAQYRRIADFVEACLDIDAVSDLFEGKIVMALNAHEPMQWALAYEFQHNGADYHLGIQGQGAPVGQIMAGRFDADRAFYPMGQPKLAGKMDQSMTTWPKISLDDLLPSVGQSVSWNLQSSNIGMQRPLSLELSRELGLAADYSRIPSVSGVFASIVGRSVIATENLRRPPRRRYGLEETNTDVSTEDAGDLPLSLFQSKNGDQSQRERFSRLQEHFLDMTGRKFDLQANVVPGTNVELDVGLQIQTSAGWVPIEQAGAGLWESLVALSAAVSDPGQVVLLDEPATNLHASWQLDLLRFLRPHHQVVVITHSPFLVPAETLDDLDRVVRLVPVDGRTVAVGLSGVAEGWRERWRQIIAGSTDARIALFVRGVLLVEGDTEVAAFRRWFNDESVVGARERGVDARNLAIISVDGDGNFGAYVSYLEQMRIPWAILCDGPAMSPDYRNGLINSFAADSETGARPTDLQGVSPEGGGFEEWRSYWAANGVFTLAETFGVTVSGEGRTGDSPSSGEIEQFFRKVDGELWSSVKLGSTSKPRRGYRFAERCDLSAHPDALAILTELWKQVVQRLDPQKS